MAQAVREAIVREGWPAALEALLNGGTNAEAAEAAGVCERTISNWKKDEDFRALYRQLLDRHLREVGDRTAARLARLAEPAVSRVARELVEKGKRGGWAAVQVYRDVLRLAGWNVQKHEHSGRVELAAVMRQVAEQGPRPLLAGELREVEQADKEGDISGDDGNDAGG